MHTSNARKSSFILSQAFELSVYAREVRTHCVHMACSQANKQTRCETRNAYALPTQTSLAPMFKSTHLSHAPQVTGGIGGGARGLRAHGHSLLRTSTTCNATHAGPVWRVRLQYCIIACLGHSRASCAGRTVPWQYKYCAIVTLEMTANPVWSWRERISSNNARFKRVVPFLLPSPSPSPSTHFAPCPQVCKHAWRQRVSRIETRARTHARDGVIGFITQCTPPLLR